MHVPTARRPCGGRLCRQLPVGHGFSKGHLTAGGKDLPPEFAYLVQFDLNMRKIDGLTLGICLEQFHKIALPGCHLAVGNLGETFTRCLTRRCRRRMSKGQSMRGQIRCSEGPSTPICSEKRSAHPYSRVRSPINDARVGGARRPSPEGALRESPKTAIRRRGSIDPVRNPPTVR